MESTILPNLYPNLLQESGRKAGIFQRLQMQYQNTHVFCKKLHLNEHACFSLTVLSCTLEFPLSIKYSIPYMVC